MWSLREGEKELKPLVFSNGKSQEDVVKEIVKEIKSGVKIIFIKGVCGTGKSAIALNIAKELGRASIVVPIKNLQKQYEQDYTNKKQVMKANEEKLKIDMIKGRQNFSCPFLLENPKLLGEENLTLDNFSLKKSRKKNKSADNSFLPCKIEIKDKNSEILKDYIKLNKNIKDKNLEFKDIRRITIASICPYWSPLLPAIIDYDFDDAEILYYKGLKNKPYKLCLRKLGCKYYEQYISYLNSNVLIFNSEKYKIECLLDRKPATDLEVIDECDEFLDSFANSAVLNLNRLNFALGSLLSEKRWVGQEIQELFRLVKEITYDKTLESKEMVPIKDTKVYNILKIFLDAELMDYVECDEENYCYHVEEIARDFSELFNETYLFFEKGERDLIVKLVTVDLGKRFKEMADKNKALVLMSGTIHSEKVLKEIFGLQDYKIIEAEIQLPGTITFQKTGLELNCKMENFKSGKITREHYLLAFSKCVQQAVKPALIHVIAFNDLPNEKEAREFNLNLMTREKLDEEQKHSEEEIKRFKAGEKDILYTTRCTRGMDFPGDSCKSIILTKYPYPDISNPFWKLLKKVRPEHYNAFYLDKARREFLQKVYRGLRFKGDHIFLLSPDSRVFDNSKVLFEA